MPKTKYSKKLFPFSPGIPWTIKNNKYIIPDIDSNIWKRVLNGKNFVVSCYGGFLESFFSLSYCEAFAKIEPNRSVTWMGNPDFEILTNYQGLVNYNVFDLGSEIIDKYPAPIFMDKNNNAYFNVLNNYIETKSYKPGYRVIQNKEICLKQIYKNCLLPWDNYKPIIRNLNYNKFKKWSKDNKFHINSKYIVVFPKRWKSMHEINALEWSDRQVRELSEMLRHLNISVISCEDIRYDAFYKAGSIIRAPLDLEIILPLIEKSYGILSADIDFLFIAMMLSNTTIIMAKEFEGILNLYDNSDFLVADNVIFTDRQLSPGSVFRYIEGM